MIAIDRNTLYESNGYYFKNFVQLSDEEKVEVLAWRNDDNVRKWMYNTDILDLQTHLQFIDSLQNCNDRFYWVVSNENSGKVGVVNVTNIDLSENRAELGYYLVPGLIGEGFSFVKECFNFFFNTLFIDKVYGAVSQDNKEAFLLDTFFGCNFNKTKTVNGTVFYVCDSFTRDDFGGKYKLDIVEYVKFARNGIRRIR